MDDRAMNALMQQAMPFVLAKLSMSSGNAATLMCAIGLLLPLLRSLAVKAARAWRAWRAPPAPPAPAESSIEVVYDLNLGHTVYDRHGRPERRPAVPVLCLLRDFVYGDPGFRDNFSGSVDCVVFDGGEEGRNLLPVGSTAKYVVVTGRNMEDQVRDMMMRQRAL